MKKIVLGFCILFYTPFLGAQNLSGKIQYAESIKIEFKMEGADADQFSHLVPKEQKTKKTLVFNETASLYKNMEETNDEVIEQESNGMAVRIKIDKPKDIVYCDLKNDLRWEQREFMTRLFLIESTVSHKDWKMTGNQKIIMGYPCQEATRTIDDKKIMAWFTPAIPLSYGPGGITGLPGLVLLVDINDGEQIMTAENIELKTIDQKELIKPKEGKKVSREEFKKIVDEKMKEMKEENGGGGNNVIIKMRK